MTDLRARITKAIADAQFAFDNGDPYNGPEDSDVLADAVIAELGLEKQTLNRQLWAAAPTVRRYITEWETE